MALISRYYLPCILAGISVLFTACSSVQYVQQPLPSGMLVQVHKVLTPNTLAIELLPVSKDSHYVSHPHQRKYTKKKKENIIVFKFAQIDIPMSEHSCDNAWSITKFQQSIKKIFDPEGIKMYGEPPYNFDYICHDLKQRFENIQLGIKIVDLNVNDRMVNGIVMLGGINQNIELVRAGIARIDYEQTHELSYITAELEARKAKRGFWAVLNQEASL